MERGLAEEGGPLWRGALFFGLRRYLQMRVAAAPGKPARTVMGLVAAALQVATPEREMVAAVVLETDQTGAWTGGSGQPGGTDRKSVV